MAINRYNISLTTSYTEIILIYNIMSWANLFH